ncbi:toxin-antitoxin system antitoxin subunit [Oribacterium asaccharolyticum]|uniref:toxin-antitoxin system antitoxin subunit n=1 Tax=Oribacterium asaccharolyticum TaxID=1501332 RepID=UPI0028EEF4FF|nr:toxin-antitoxin system antitoxin subunit [Oribacterium asaccharolyticum]
MPKIIPIKELKDMAKVSEICRKERIYKDLEVAESDILAGRTKPAGLVLKELQRKTVE